MAIYLDNNATTPLVPEVWEAMRPFLEGPPGNPASSHRFGRHARKALEDSRERIAGFLDAAPDEVIFTSGATEANNLAVSGLAAPAPGSIVVSSVEHPSVLEPARQRAAEGYTLATLPVTERGSIDLSRADFPADMRLLSVMLANHETGALQPMEALVERLRGQAPFHCDAAAAVGKIPVSFRRLGVTAMTISAHKFHGPQGIGALILKQGTKLRPLFRGGHQQHGRRPGSEPVALAVGMAAALDWCIRNQAEHLSRVTKLRQRFLDRLRAESPPVVLNGPETDGVPHTINLSFPGCAADVFLMNLDLAGVACSTGSACSSGSLLPSPVLRAMGLEAPIFGSAMRFSLSALTAEVEIDKACGLISQCARDLRRAGEAEIYPDAETKSMVTSH